MINDGCDDGVEEIVKKYADKINLRYHYLRHTGNRGRNRNTGAARAKGERLIFLDSDMIPGRHLIKHFDRATKKDRRTVSLGVRRSLTDFDRKYIDENLLESHFEILDNLPAINDDRTETMYFQKLTGHGWRGNWQILYSHCFCIWKDVFQAVNGFDEHFSKHWGAEDIELGYRLYKSEACRIVVNEKALCYHVYHSENILKKIASLKMNYELFIRKHEDWEVELFTREFECSSMKAIGIQNRIIERRHLVTDLGGMEDMLKRLPSKTILAGIEVEALLESEKVETAYLPESRLRSGKIKNQMGLLPDFGKNHFHLAVLSGEYKNVDPGVYVLLEERLSNIAKKVVTLDNGEKDPARQLAGGDRKASRTNKNLLFMLVNDVNSSINRYNYVQLALAAHNIGIGVSIELCYDPYREIDINAGFLFSKDKEKMKLLKQLRSDAHSFIGDSIPCIMDTDSASFHVRALGRRMFWENLQYINQEKFFELERFQTYSTLLLKSDRERKIFQHSPLEKHWLPVGVDKEKIDTIKKARKARNERFTFLCAERFALPFSNVRLVLEAFTREFGNDRRVLLKIILPGNFKLHYRNKFFGESFNKMVENSVLYVKQSADAYAADMTRAYGNVRNVALIKGDVSEEEASRELCASDCFISVKATTDIHPLVLEAYAFGIPSIVPDAGIYGGYIPAGSCYRVKTEKVSALFDIGSLEQPNLATLNMHRYFLMHRPEEASVRRMLRAAFRDRNSPRVGAEEAKRFAERCNWTASAERLRRLLF